MKKHHVALVVLALAVTAFAGVAQAHVERHIALGVVVEGDETYSYAYGQIDLSPSLAAGLAYYSTGAFELSLFHGVERGFYGELELPTGGGNPVIEVGVWANTHLSPSANVVGWLGAQTALSGDEGVWVRANAEAEIALSGPFALFVGADTTIFKKNNTSSIWAGVGYHF